MSLGKGRIVYVCQISIFQQVVPLNLDTLAVWGRHLKFRPRPYLGKRKSLRMCATGVNGPDREARRTGLEWERKGGSTTASKIARRGKMRGRGEHRCLANILENAPHCARVFFGLVYWFLFLLGWLYGGHEGDGALDLFPLCARLCLKKAVRLGRKILGLHTHDGK